MKKLHPFTLEFSHQVKKAVRTDLEFQDKYPDEFNRLSHKFCLLAKEEQIQVAEDLSKNYKFSKTLMQLVMYQSNNHISQEQKKKLLASSHEKVKANWGNQIADQSTSKEILDVATEILFDLL